MVDGLESEQRQLIRRGLRLVGGFVRSHPAPFAISVLGSLMMAVGTVLSTVMLGWLTDDVILPTFDGTEPRRSTGVVVLALLAVAAGRSAGVVTRRYFAGMAVHRSKSDLQLRLGDHYLAMAPDQLRGASRGRLLAHADSDADVATDALSPFPFTIGVIALLIVSVGSLALVDWVLMVVALGLMPLIVGLNRLNARFAEAPAIDVREAVARVSSVASESFDGAMIVKTLGRQDAELERFSVEAAQLRDHSVRLGRVRALFAAALNLVPDLGVVLLVSLGAWRAANDYITPGQLVQAVALFTLLAFPLHVIGFFFGDLPPAVVAHDRIVATLSSVAIHRNGTDQLPPGAMDLRVSELTVRYGDVAVVDNVTLHARRGEILALVGPTGCGKSTLLSAVLDMVPIAAGGVSIADREISAISAAVMAGRVAMVWQQPFLLDASIAKNIAFGAPYSREEIERAARAAGFHDVALDLPQRYETVVGEGGVRLSGGQRQRLALARAIVRAPGLLLLDDATSAIDPIVEERILDSLRAIDTTMVVVAHRRSTVMLADRVALMNRGRITAVGSHAELLTEPAYAALLDAYDMEARS